MIMGGGERVKIPSPYLSRKLHLIFATKIGTCILKIVLFLIVI